MWNWYNIMALPIYSYVWYLLICFDLLAFFYHSKTVFLHALFPPQSSAWTVPAGPSQINLWYFFLVSCTSREHHPSQLEIGYAPAFCLPVFSCLLPVPQHFQVATCVCPCPSTAQHLQCTAWLGMWGGRALSIHAMFSSCSTHTLDALLCLLLFFYPVCLRHEKHRTASRSPVTFPLTNKIMSLTAAISQMLLNQRKQSCCLRPHTKLGSH